MTNAIDKFLVEHGFEECELKDIKHRSVLYHGILVMSLSAFTFTGLAIAAWA